MSLTPTRRQLLGSIASLLAAAPLAAAGSAAPTNGSRRDPITPPRLRPGMTMGLLAPASTVVDDEAIDAAADLVRSLGFEVRRAPNLGARTQYLAGTDEQRAEDFNTLVRDPDVDALICVRGGYGSSRILPMLDYDALAAKPRVVLGYSDITSLLNAIHVRTSVVTFHGPIAAANFSDYTYAEYRKVLVDAAGPVRLAAPPPFETRPGVVERENRLTTLAPGRAEGRLVGGNLSLLVHLLGTPFEPDFDGAILFCEDVYEAPYSIDRMLTHLWLAGKLQQCAGIALGKFTDADYDGNTFSVEAVLRQRLADLGVPVLSGLMIGHVDDQSVIPIGARARLDADAGTLELLTPAVT